MKGRSQPKYEKRTGNLNTTVFARILVHLRGAGWR
jgi:hypothetical protein